MSYSKKGDSQYWEYPDSWEHCARILDGRKYDTKTAEKIVGDFNSGTGSACWKILYRKKNGEFFFYIIELTIWEGCDDTRYITECLDCEARTFCEPLLGVEKYECIFGPVEE